MNSLADDLRTLLIADGVVSSTVTNDWSIHIGDLPPSPDKAVKLQDTSGLSPIYLFGGDTVHRDRCQATVRSNDYLSSYSKCHEIIDSLALTSRDSSLEGSSYWMIIQSTPVSYFGKDDNERFLFIVSFQVQRE